MRSLPLLPRPVCGRAERTDAGAEFGQPAVVLVADQPAGVGGVDEVVADQPLGLTAGDHVEHADALDVQALLGDELVPEHLVGAADGQHHHAVVGHRAQLRAARGEVGADVALGRVLAAAAEQDVGVGGQRVADADRHDPDVEAAPLEAPLAARRTLPVSP